ncbi:MAG: hypothetical protein AB8C84_05740 [Oligoflexales bacterium]
MLSTILNLIKLVMSSFIRQIRYQVIRESSIFFSMAIFLLLIRYISQDFLNKILHQISAPMYEQATTLWVYSVMIMSSWGLRLSFTEQSISQFASFYSTPKNPLFFFKILEKFIIPLLILMIIGSLLGLSFQYSFHISYLFILCLCILYIPKHTRSIHGLPFHPSNTAIGTQIRWRLSQIIRSEWSQVSLLLFTMIIPWILSNYPKLYQQALWVWVLSFGYALVIIKGMSQALKNSHFEKTAGLSHVTWLFSFEITILILSLIPSSLIFYATQNAHLCFIMLATPWLVPWVLLQLDGKRPALVIPSLWLCSIFWSTALLAHPAFIICAFPIRAFGYQSQHDRFYGA